MGREVARILPGGQRETKAYNAAGELIAMTDFNGVTTRYDYDRQGSACTLKNLAFFNVGMQSGSASKLFTRERGKHRRL